jgi:hypothetical protein
MHAVALRVRPALRAAGTRLCWQPGSVKRVCLAVHYSLF